MVPEQLINFELNRINKDLDLDPYHMTTKNI